MKRWDVAILGSGISSLTCALLLSKMGRSVCVLEKYLKPGGYLHCFNRFGVRFDTGAHYVGAMDPGDPFHTLLSYLGVYDPDLFVPLDPSGFDVFHFPSFEARFAKGYDQTMTSLGEIFPRERSAIARYLGLVQSVAARFPTYQYNESFNTAALLEAVETPLSRVVEGLTDNPKLRFVLYSYCSLHGVEPDDVSFGFHAIVTDSLIRSAHGFRHGGDGLAAKMVAKIEEQGGQVLTRSEVSRLEVNDRSITSIHTKRGERIEASQVISGIHPKALLRLIEPSVFKPAFRQRVEALRESLGIFGIYAIASKKLPLSPLQNHFYFDSDDSADLFRKRGPVERPAVVFVSRPDRMDSSQSPFPLILHAPGPAEWFSEWKTTSTGKRPVEYHRLKDLYARSILEWLGQQNPELAQSVDQFVTSSPLSNLHFNGSEDGSAYGIYHSIQNSGARALGPQTHIRNLLLTGQNCLFPGLLGGATSAIRTCGVLLGNKSILKELRAMGR